MQLAVAKININHWDIVILEYGANSGSCALKHCLLFVHRTASTQDVAYDACHAWKSN